MTDEELHILTDAATRVISRLAHKMGTFIISENPFRREQVYEHGRRHSMYVRQIPNLDFGYVAHCIDCRRAFRLLKFTNEDWCITTPSPKAFDIQRLNGHKLVAYLEANGDDAMIKYQLDKSLFCTKYMNLE